MIAIDRCAMLPKAPGARAALFLGAAGILTGCTSESSNGPPSSPVLDGGGEDAAYVVDATIADAAIPPEAAPDAPTRAPDGSPDVLPDATPEGSIDAGTDGSHDASGDASPDASVDAGDAGPDASVCGDGGPLGVFADDFSAGVRATYWTIAQTNPDAGVYSYADDAGDLHFAKVGANPGGTQSISATLAMAAIGGPVAGDFTMSVDFRSAILGASSIDQIELHVAFEDTSYFFDVYTNENGLEFHVWDGAFETGFNTSADAATMQIVRTGSTLTAYAITAADGGADAGARQVFSKTGSTSALTSASFILQNYDTNNDISVTYDNFLLRGACVHP